MLNHRIRWRVLLGIALGLAGNVAAAQTRLFMPAPTVNALSPAGTTQAASRVSPSQRVVALDTAAMQTMKTGDEVLIVAPNDATYTALYDRTEIAYGGGKVWVGHLANFTDEYPVIIST